MSSDIRLDALQYHSQPRPGKVETLPCKPCFSQRDLTLAYSPGVAEPCLRLKRILLKAPCTLVAPTW